MGQKTKIGIALLAFAISVSLEMVVPYPRENLVGLMIMVYLIGAFGIFYLLASMPISKPIPPRWLPFPLALIIFCLLMAPFYIELEIVSNILSSLSMIFMIIFFGVGIFGFYTMYKNIKKQPNQSLKSGTPHRGAP
jgi:amino acid transporter